MVQMYESKAAPAHEIMDMFGIGNGSFYRILHNHGVPAHQKRNGKVKARKLTPEETKALFPTVPEETEVPVVHATRMEVVLDKGDLVQATKREVRRLDTWEIKYSGTVLVEADDIEEAIRAARKLGAVKRIYSVRVKGQ